MKNNVLSTLKEIKKSWKKNRDYYLKNGITFEMLIDWHYTGKIDGSVGQLTILKNPLKKL
jgi:hypothetical protein